jgi:hypothetical protein
MAFTTAGLANGGVTTHYRFQYDDSLQQLPTNPNGPEPARTNLVIAVCDSDFGLMSAWFRNIALDARCHRTVLQHRCHRETQGMKTGMARAPVFHDCRRVKY